ncbi:MAG TPA: UDP-4-amino-4,6-dideoxy-N-acetyl-beta-L-altrosamine transaminase [Dongiaceae bacterium]|nr:UDP-4-amino-4,6-dideoxy-N-acetyl-beta-L-altrosamine transaminase [Dongiaceae bacterium]
MNARALRPAAATAPQENFLPYGRQTIDDQDILAVAAILRSDYLTTGPAAEAFERAVADFVGADHAIACSNGTAALHLAMMALGVGPGDAVIVPTITFLSTANAARFCGADVIFADVDPDTALMTPATLREAIARAGARKIKAIVPVHLGGSACAMEEIAVIAQKIGAAIVEDACHALATSSEAGRVGNCRHSNMTVFSFHPVKTIATGEGGMVTTRDPDMAQKLRRLRNHGVVREADEFVDASLSSDTDGLAAPWAYEMQSLGYNYRLSDIQAALGLSQMRKLPAFANRRRALSLLYADALPAHIDHVRMNPGACPHLFIALMDFSAASRGELIRRLRQAGIGAQVHYMPVHRQPYYKALYGETHLPGAEKYYSRCLSLPLFPGMTDDDALRVVEALG